MGQDERFQGLIVGLGRTVHGSELGGGKEVTILGTLGVVDTLEKVLKVRLVA
jgi:hypothetical protein